MNNAKLIDYARQGFLGAHQKELADRLVTCGECRYFRSPVAEWYQERGIVRREYGSFGSCDIGSRNLGYELIVTPDFSCSMGEK